MIKHFTFAIFLGLSASPLATANGVLRWGFGARDTGSAGAFSGTDGDAITALHVNPALLSQLPDNQWIISSRYLRGNSTFNRGGISSSLNNGEGAYPDFALAWRPDDSAFTFGFGVSPVSALEANWNYLDADGGIGDISFGTVDHESRFVAIRLAVAAAWQINDHWSVGMSAGAIYSEVDFNAPFIFQTNPALANAKVNLDMENDGWNPSFEFGALYQPSKEWNFGARIKLPVELDNDGKAGVDYSAQLPPLGLAPASALAGYDARARVELPLTIGTGASWKPSDRWNVGLWIDWHQWSRSYDTLKVDLSNGSNAQINGAIGSGPTDRVPLDWKDRFVFSLGSSYQLNDEWTLRGGYRFGKSPIPDNLVTPLNAATLEHTLSLGASWQRGDWRLDLAYAHEFADTSRVGQSGYNAGEYSNSSLETSIDHFSLSVGRSF